jgi:putative endonuclease
MKDKLDGYRGEDAAAAHLESMGYVLRERNYSSYDEYGRALWEVDIIAERGDVLAFVEVRSRATDVFGDPEETVTTAKQRRIVRAALHFLTRHQIHDRDVRFDVISIVATPAGMQLHHLEDAFDAGL